jgi:transposase
MHQRATQTNPGLMAIKGVGPVTGAQLLITAGDNPDRLRTSASFAALSRGFRLEAGPKASRRRVALMPGAT